MNQKTKITVVIVALLIAAGSFYGGMTYAQSKVPSFARAGGAAFAAGGATRGMRGGAAGGFVSGEVISKDATSLTLKLTNGGSKIVFLSASTTVMKTATGSMDDIAVGQQITTTGSTNTDGSMTAQTIQVRPAQAPVPAR